MTGRSTGRSRWRILAARLGLVAMGLLLAFCLVETALRLGLAPPPVSPNFWTFFQPDPDVGWHGRPEYSGRFVHADFDATTRHGSDGFRACAVPHSIDDDRDSQYSMVWCVGDSLTWGWGVSDGETYVDELNRRAEAAGEPTRYRNLGIPGYSALQEYLLLKQQFALGRRPDLVVVFYCFNDWEGNFGTDIVGPRPVLARQGADWHVVDSSTAPASLSQEAGRWLLRNSRTLERAYLGYKTLRCKVAAWRSSQRTTPAMPEPVVTAEQCDAMRHVYRQLRDLCRSEQVELVVANEFYECPELSQVCAELGIPLLNATSYLPPGYDIATCADDELLHFRHDRHWTPRGQQLMARFLDDGLHRLPLAARESAAVRR